MTAARQYIYCHDDFPPIDRTTVTQYNHNNVHITYFKMRTML